MIAVLAQEREKIAEAAWAHQEAMPEATPAEVVESLKAEWRQAAVATEEEIDRWGQVAHEVIASG